MKANTEELIIKLGENIFPMKLRTIYAEENDSAFMEALDLKLIASATSKIGTSPQTMSTPKGYIELTEEGWKQFKILKPE